MTHNSLDILTSNKGIKASQISESINRVLEGSTLCSIATVNEQCAPHVNTCFFSYTQDLELFVFTSPHTIHAKNIDNRSACAVNVFSTDQKIGDDLLGAQLFGTAHKLNTTSGLRAFNNYVIRFPVLLSWAASWDAILKGFESRFYKIIINSGKILDEKAFGKEEYVEFSIKR